MNTLSKKTSAILVLALCFTAVDAQACGEVMYRMGGALRYHAFVTRHPAQILIYAGPAALQHPSADTTSFHENLEKAGHTVTVVKDPDALAQALGAHQYDVIITYAGDVNGVTRQLANTSREPALIPIVDRSAANEREMRERFPHLVTEDANLNQFLKLIEQSMKSKGA